MEYLRSYTINNEQIIKEIVNLFVEKIDEGIYLVLKDRDGNQYKQIIGTDDLIQKMNKNESTGIKSEKGILAYSQFLDNLKVIDQRVYIRNNHMQRDSELDGMI